MDKIAVFVDDAEHARQLLAPLIADGSGRVQWVVVACAPKLTHRIGKWVAHSSREHWREHWLRTLRAKLEPVFGAAAATECEWVLARGSLDALSGKLRRRFGSDLRLLDARRPKLGATLAPVSAEQQPAGARWTAPVAVSSSLAVMLALTD